jgi:stage V sporulation protein S
MTESEEPIFRVSSGASPQATASAIAHALYESPEVKIRAVGAGAVNQAMKAITIARGYVAPRGMDLYVVPGFVTIKSHDGDISALLLKVCVS